MTGLYSDARPNLMKLGLCVNNTVHSSRRNGFMIEPTNHPVCCALLTILSLLLNCSHVFVSLQLEMDNDGLKPSDKLPFFGYLPVQDGKPAFTVVSGLRVYKTMEKGLLPLLFR